MTVHLLKLAVGAESVQALVAFQRARLEAAAADGRPGRLVHMTRNRPRREDEVLDGGSLYWVIKGQIRARQRILGFETTIGRRGRPRCVILLDPTVVATVPRPHRAMQGWRYLDPADAPPDLGAFAEAEEEMPSGMAEELQRLGLL